jgi:hypothetical protein
MMFARIGSWENDYFTKPMCKEMFSEKSAPNPIVESYQNLSALLFGITVNNRNVMGWHMTTITCINHYVFRNSFYTATSASMLQ